MKESCEKQDKTDEDVRKLTVFNHMNALVGELWPDMELVANVDRTGKPFDPANRFDIESVAIFRGGSFEKSRLTTGDSPAALLCDLAGMVFGSRPDDKGRDK
jgi:hypothetical protein